MWGAHLVHKGILMIDTQTEDAIDHFTLVQPKYIEVVAHLATLT